MPLSSVRRIHATDNNSYDITHPKLMIIITSMTTKPLLFDDDYSDNENKKDTSVHDEANTININNKIDDDKTKKIARWKRYCRHQYHHNL